MNVLLQRKSHSYFQGVYTILNDSLQFFTPPGGLTVERAMNEGKRAPNCDTL